MEIISEKNGYINLVVNYNDLSISDTTNNIIVNQIIYSYITKINTELVSSVTIQEPSINIVNIK